ncbi:MAG: oligosaccharide flippase family protein [Muribaculum sp.]|nr:oligosaccharide flippase family protein [Muribaculaceae bacterium]MCM1081281.1 oligosaccharide flippase family protein [Muribaculum sp.]
MTQQSLNSYKNIFRGMKIFGGVQAFQMFVSLLRGKFVSIFLGQGGMGISTLFTSSASTIQQLAALGVPIATARDVAGSVNNVNALSRLVAASRLATSITGLLAAIGCAVFASTLSNFTFGTSDQTYNFIMLGAVVWLQMAGANEVALMQGMRQLKRLGRSSLAASAVGLCFAAPMYYLWGNSAIVPSLLVMATIAFGLYRYNSSQALRQVGIITFNGIKFGNMWNDARSLLSFGIILTSAAVATQATMYLANVFISSVGSYDDLGLYSAGSSICTQCIAMIFAAMAMDYFPRLVKCIQCRDEWLTAVQRQAELVALFASPIAIALIFAAPYVIEILFTDDFLPMTTMLRYMAAGIFLRSLSYPLGYITLAKGNKALYFCLEGIVCNIVFILAMCLGYFAWGVNGLGIATIIIYGADTIVYYVVNRYAYGFRYGSACRRTLPILLLPVVLSLTASVALPTAWANVSVAILFIATSAYAIRKLNNLLKN